MRNVLGSDLVNVRSKREKDLKKYCIDGRLKLHDACAFCYFCNCFMQWRLVFVFECGNKRRIGN
jgi:hypothetical protein